MQNELYRLELYRYIELNPVRAGMVDEPSAYSWSSYSVNALGVKSDLQTPHSEYLALGKTNALGNNKFTTQIEALTNKRVTARKAGRPKKRGNNSDNNQLILL